MSRGETRIAGSAPDEISRSTVSELTRRTSAASAGVMNRRSIAIDAAPAASGSMAQKAQPVNPAKLTIDQEVDHAAVLH
jgi:hypothetical protein